MTDVLQGNNLTDGVDVSVEPIMADRVPAVDRGVELIPFQNLFEITRPTVEQRKQLETIVDYVKETAPSVELTERLWHLKQVENRLSRPRMGESRLGKLYQYIEVDRQVKQGEKLRDSYLNG